MSSIITKSAKNAAFGAKTGQKSKIARIFVLLIFAITEYWHNGKNKTRLVSAQFKKTDASKLGRCGEIRLMRRNTDDKKKVIYLDKLSLN